VEFKKMTLTLKLTAKELELLCGLASHQLFRREYIDARLPGFESNPVELGLGKQLIERLRMLTDRAKRAPLARKNGAAA
jgi:hypothetical protein